MESFPPDWENLERTLRQDVSASVATLLAAVDELNTLTDRTNADINANPAAAIKVVAREVKTVARQTLRLARLASGMFDSADIGE